MHFTRHSLVSVLVVPAILASPITSIRSSSIIQRRHAPEAANGKAVYFITNGDENAVAAVLIKKDGTLGDASVTATGGCGSASVDATGKRAVPDSLVSQSALTLAGQNIFAVNAGSNTVSMFVISPDDPLSLQLVGQPASLPGIFPNTVAASVKNSLVCVGTTGSKAGISCANFDAQNGIGQMDAIRPFELGQSDPPVGPTNTVSQTFFSEDETMLFTTVKGDPAVNNTGFLSVFPIEGSNTGNSTSCGAAVSGASAKLSIKETRSSPAGTAVLFGSQPIPGTNPPQIFATDASFGAAVLALDSTMSATLTGKGVLADQKATCWAAISTLTNTAFVTDVSINRIVEMSMKDASIIGQIDLSKEPASALDPGLTDMKAAGGFLYALSAGNGTTDAAISVVDVKSKKLVQHAKLGMIGVGPTAMGMAVLL